MQFFLEIVSTVLLLTCVAGQKRDDPCILDATGQAGLCQHISMCPVVLKAAFEGIPPQTCSFEGTVAVVCCPQAIVSEGSSCTIKDTGKTGKCSPFANCQAAMVAASKGVLPQKCNTKNFSSDLVCCAEPTCEPLPPGAVTQLPIGSKAADYCIKLAEEIYPCQQTGSGVTRGNLCQPVPASNVKYNMARLTTSDEAPHYGRIGTGDKDSISWQGAPVTLVSDRWVVSAASAVQYIGVGSIKFAGLGGSFTPQKYTPDASYHVTTIVIHPEYNSAISRSYNDIALLQLEKKVTFTSRILPSCLHTGTPLPESGFIHTGGDGGYAFPDSKTTMRIPSLNECSRRFNDKRYHPDGVKHTLEICGFPVQTTTSCATWSSGSPLYLYNGPRVSCTHLLVGISSTWKQAPCSFIFTRISAFVPWLESIIWP